MNALVKIVAGLGAVVFTAAAVGLPDVCEYCTARAMSAVEAHHVVASDTQHVQPGQTSQVSLRDIRHEYRRLPI